jgi:transposase-like protein
MPAPYPREFRDDVVAVARRRDPGVTLKQIAEDFGIAEASLTNWLKTGRYRGREATRSDGG